MADPIVLKPDDPTPAGAYVDDDWFRFYGPAPGTLEGTSHMEVHEYCSGARCAYRDEPCSWHPPGCACSQSACQVPPVR